MKVYTRLIIDLASSAVLEEDSYEYDGPVALCKSAGQAPQPTDPYQQAGAQYLLSTGTADYNAALGRPNSVNPLGSSTWGVTGLSSDTPQYSAAPTQQPQGGGAMGLGGSGIPMMQSGQGAPAPAPAGSYEGSAPSVGGYPSESGAIIGNSGDQYAQGLYGIGTGAPEYTQSTQLAPQFESLLQQPVSTQGIPEFNNAGVVGNVNQAENAAFNQQMGYLQPQEALQSEGLNSQLAAEGNLPGSAGWNNGQQLLGQQQTFENTQAANNAVLTGQQVASNLYGLGNQQLQAELQYQQAPINEYNALNGNPAATAGATTPDISGAFGQQYQGQLNAYNAGVATNNANTQAGGALAGDALMALLSTSDERVKDDIHKVGELDSGENVYTFRYKGQPKTHMGVMAQEIEKTKPGAVFNLGGVKAVNYGALSR